jgi:hypothetical protein
MAFNEEQYYADKLAHLQATGKTQYTNTDQVKRAFADAGLTAQQHYEQFGKNEGIGTTYKAPIPSSGNITQPSAFPYQNENEYYAAKLAQLQATGKPQYTDINQVKQAFADSGLTAQQHYEQFGKNEGVGTTYTPTRLTESGDTWIAGKIYNGNTPLTTDQVKQIYSDINGGVAPQSYLDYTNLTTPYASMAYQQIQGIPNSQKALAEVNAQQQYMQLYPNTSREDALGAVRSGGYTYNPSLPSTQPQQPTPTLVGLPPQQQQMQPIPIPNPQQQPSWMNEMQSWWTNAQQQWQQTQQPPSWYSQAPSWLTQPTAAPTQAPTGYVNNAFPQYTPNYANNALMQPVTQNSNITAQNQYGNMGYNNQRSSLWGDW